MPLPKSFYATKIKITTNIRIIIVIYIVDTFLAFRTYASIIFK